MNILSGKEALTGSDTCIGADGNSWHGILTKLVFTSVFITLNKKALFPSSFFKIQLSEV